MGFFYSRISINKLSPKLCEYTKQFPFISLCGPERNFIGRDDVPVVFTHLLNKDKEVVEKVDEAKYLAFGGYQKGLHSWKLVHPFDKNKIYWHEKNGRMYHPAKDRYCGVGLIKSQLAIDCFDQLDNISQKSDLGELVEKFSMLGKDFPSHDSSEYVYDSKLNFEEG